MVSLQAEIVDVIRIKRMTEARVHQVLNYWPTNLKKRK